MCFLFDFFGCKINPSKNSQPLQRGGGKNAPKANASLPDLSAMHGSFNLGFYRHFAKVVS